MSSPPAPRATLPPAAVEVAEVRFTYGSSPRGAEVLGGVSFTVAPGVSCGVLGPNGSGKSTLFRLVATLSRPTAGQISIGGHDTVTAGAAVRRQLGVVFQNPSLDPHLTVEENLRCHGRLFGLGGKALSVAIAASLERFGLGSGGVESSRRRQLVKTLSGGLRRRAELAKALLTRPALLLLDEPSTGLDPAARHDLRQALREVRDAGTTVLWTTHLMDEAEACDQLVLLDRGLVVAAGSPTALRSAVAGEVVSVEGRDPAALLSAAQQLAPDLVMKSTPTGIRIEAPGDGLALVAALLPSLRATLRGSLDDVDPISAVTVAQPTLEDVFLRHTGRRLDASAGLAGAAA